MPTENERKYVLRMDSAAEIRRITAPPIGIKQGYLESIRIRRAAHPHKYGVDVFHKLTYKHKVNNRLIEIETDIDERDFNDLYGECRKGDKLHKHRHVMNTSSGIWEMDLFLNGNKIYFVMAEIELPENVIAPDHLPDIISNNLVYLAPPLASGFSSRKLCDPDYAAKLYAQLVQR